MATVKYTLDLNPYGINKNVSIGVEEIVNGQGVDKFPRTDFEKSELDKIIALEGIKNKDIQQKMGAGLAFAERRQEEIKDPIGLYMKEAKEKATERSPGMFGGITRAGGELLDILPGGDPFEPAKIGEGLYDQAVKMLVQGDPKTTTTDAAVIGADLALAAESINAEVPNAKRNIRNAIFQNLKKSPAASAAAVIGTSAAAKGSANFAYDQINDAIRWLNSIPQPDEDTEMSEMYRNIMDIRDEALFTGGAVGLQQVWPHVKKFLGKRLFGVDKGMKVDAGIDVETGKPVQIDLLKASKQEGVGMNVFTASNAGFVNAVGKVIGLFPFVATRARQAQNAQQIEIAANINNTLNDLSPISLFADSGILANKEFKNMIKSFAGTKKTLYTNAFEVADKIDDKFIPTSRLKAEAAALRTELFGPKGQRPEALIADSPETGYVNMDEALSQFTGKAEDFERVLLNFEFLRDDFMTGRQFSALQRKLNKMKQVAAADASLGVDTGNVENFTKAMIETLNDFGSFREFEDPAKNMLVKEFSGKMSLANDFFFSNINFTKGRTSQILKMADKNIAKNTQDVDPGFITGDQVTKILLNDDTMTAPLAIKEMKKAMGDDAVKAIARSHFDDKIRGATQYISGTVRTKGEPTLFGQTKAFLSGKEAVSPDKTSVFNIPILNVKALKDEFGINNLNKQRSVIEVFGKEQFEKIRNTLALAEQVQQTNFGEVSDFVKRRGFLGGVNAITNLAFAGFVAADPFANVGSVLLARYGMSKMADPKFLDSLVDVLNADLATTARRTALIKLGSMAFDQESDNKNVPSEVLQNFDAGNPMDVMKLLIFSTNNAPSYPGSEDMVIGTNDEGRVLDIEISKSNNKNMFSKSVQNTVQNIKNRQNIKQANERQVAAAAPKRDPFLVDNLAATMQGQTPSPSQPLTADQRIALAGGNLDEAIAMKGRV